MVQNKVRTRGLHFPSLKEQAHNKLLQKPPIYSAMRKPGSAFYRAAGQLFFHSRSMSTQANEKPVQICSAFESFDVPDQTRTRVVLRLITHHSILITAYIGICDQEKAWSTSPIIVLWCLKCCWSPKMQRWDSFVASYWSDSKKVGFFS